MLVGTMLRAAAAGSLVALAVSCDCDPRDQWVKKVGREIEPVARGVDYWGTASISTPLLTTPQPQFSFDLKQSALTYYSHARSDINGGIGVSTESSSLTTSGQTVQANIDTMVKAALAIASGGVTAIPSALSPTTAPAISTDVLPSSLPASSVLMTANFAALQGLLAGDKPILDDRTAILLAAGNKATQDILAYLAGPSTAVKFKDKLVLFGTGMVSVQPGTHTSVGYAADLDVSAAYIEVPARTDVLDKMQVSDRIALYKACLRENWSDANDAANDDKKAQDQIDKLSAAMDGVVDDHDRAALAGRLDQARQEEKSLKEAMGSAHRDYMEARAHYLRCMLYEARKLAQTSGVTVDTTPLYTSAYKPKEKAVGTADAKGSAKVPPGAHVILVERAVPDVKKPDPAAPPSPPAASELFALAQSIDDLSAHDNGKIRVLRVDAAGNITFDGGSITRLVSFIEQADGWNQVAFANTLRTAVKSLEQQAEDAKLLRAAMTYADNQWTVGATVTEDQLGKLTFAPAGHLGPDLQVSDRDAFSLPLSGPRPTRPDIGGYSIGHYSTPSSFSYRYFKSGSKSPPAETWNTPYIAALSPMSDSQILDLRESSRKQQENATKLAVALSFLGAQGQSQAFSDYVKRQQEDVTTLSGDNVELAYSKGDQFGFQVTPRLKAVESAGSSKSAQVLDPVSFPVLLVIGIEQEDVRLFPWKNRDGIYVPGENQVQFRQATRWTPQLVPFIIGGYPIWPDFLAPERLKETERMDWAAHLRRAQRELPKSPTADDEEDVQSLNNRIQLLGRMAIDDWDSQYVPADLIVSAYVPPAAAVVPAVASVTPARLHVTPSARPTTQPIVLAGSGLKDVQATSVTLVVAGPADPNITLDPSSFKVLGDGAIELGLLVNGTLTKPTGVYFQIGYTSDTGDQKTVLTPPVVLDSFESQSLKIERSSTKDAKGNQKDAVEFSPAVNANTLERYLKGPEEYWLPPRWFELPEWLGGHRDHAPEPPHPFRR